MKPDHARGALLGLVVGDALGTTLEFATPAAPAFPQLADGPLREIVGAGPFALAPGQVTDDSHMAICLATSLSERQRFDADDAAGRYVAWLPHTFDVGAQTRDALARIANGAAPAVAGRESWEQSDRRSAGNGSLMRTAPIGALLAGDELARRRAAIADSAITHFDPRCRLACAAFDAAIAAAVVGASAPVELANRARRELTAAAAELVAKTPDCAREIDDARDQLAADIAAARRPDPDLYSPTLHLHRHQGFVRVGFRLAFWELLHAPGFEAGLIDAVNRGGDADTNGAITGALLGAFYGAAEIPDRWGRAVMSALPARPDAPLTDRYHPRRLLAALDCWLDRRGCSAGDRAELV